jgi:hypothetical protein
MHLRFSYKLPADDFCRSKIHHMYTQTWKKYLPVIKLLLKKSATADQVVTLNRIDFENQSRARKPVCSFSVELQNARINSVNPPVNAKDLLEVLLVDDGTRALLRKHHYGISLASDFKLTIRDLSPQPPVTENKAEQESDASE